MGQLHIRSLEQQLRNRRMELELELVQHKELELVLVRSRLELFRNKKPCVHGA
jgi:hypothetical protein